MKKVLILTMLLAAAVTLTVGCSRQPVYEEEEVDDSAWKKQQEAQEFARRAERAYKRVCDLAMERRRSDNIQGAIDAYKEYPSRYRSTDWWQLIQSEIKKLEKSIEGKQNWQDFRQKLDDLIAQGKYKEAYFELNLFKEDYGYTYGNTLRRYEERLKVLVAEQRENEQEGR